MEEPDFAKDPARIIRLRLALQAEAVRLLVTERGWSVDDLASCLGFRAKKVRELMRYFPPAVREAMKRRAPGALNDGVATTDPVAPLTPPPGVGTVSASPTHTGPGEPGIFLVGDAASGTRTNACAHVLHTSCNLKENAK
ncbi:hypothetical protein MesoLjLa_57210 [Mesorhizobium sp. L-2-11]|nr:hypothetical protein MesoLjLa_57210 [Mesorhizobium sp. L-2-11]